METIRAVYGTNIDTMSWKIINGNTSSYTSTGDNRNIVRAVRKDPKITASDINQELHSAEVKASQDTVRNINTTTRCKPLISGNNQKAIFEFAGR